MGFGDSTEVIDISDSDTNSSSSELNAESVAQTSRPQSTVSASDSVLVIESSDSDEYWGDSDDLAEFTKAVELIDLNSEGALFSEAPSKASSPTRVSAAAEANKTLVLTSSDDEPTPVSLSMQQKNKSTTVPGTSKTITNISATIRGQSKRSIPRESKNANVVLIQTRGLDKVDPKLQREVNKLITDRKSTIKDFTVEISYDLQDLPFVDLFSEKIAPHNGKVAFFEPPTGVEHLIRFRRRHIARYDTTTKEWVPIEACTRLEDLYIVLLSAEQLIQAVSEESLPGTLSNLRDTHRLTNRSQIFLMVDGMNARYKRKGGKIKRDVVESSMTFLQAVERCFIVHMNGPEDTSQWLFNITGDLGIKPHKRVQDSFLPFCTDTKVKCGTSKADTYKKMLQQIHGITESAADGIMEKAPTLRSLFEGYDEENDPHTRHERLKQVMISNRKDGVAKSRILNQALSKKVHDVMWGQDPLTLVL
ncbi:hypothetical protein FRC12_012268 [Ceratobasidium sp. 428]|nr:hypothetical protein FRC12_012268 [Ceratobasidium sp. 428]